MTLKDAQELCDKRFGENGVAMQGSVSGLCYVGRWANPEITCLGDYCCLGMGKTFEEAFAAVGKMTAVINP